MALGTTGALAATFLAVFLLAAGANAASPAAAFTLTAPYYGTADHAQSTSVVGCGSASHPHAAHFDLTTGVATLAEKASATTCTVANGTSSAVAYGTAGLTFSLPWNFTSGNGSSSRVVAAWTLAWISTVRISGNGSIFYGVEQTEVGATFAILDLTTNQTVGSTSWSHSTTFNLTKGSTQLNGSAVVPLAFHVHLVTGNVYEITTEVSGLALSQVQGLGARTAIVTLNMATQGAKGYLQSIAL